MNKQRRAQIENVKQIMLGAWTTLVDAKGRLEEIRDAEQEAFDGMPESLQGSEKGEQSEAAIAALDEVIDAISDLENCDIEETLTAAAE